MSIDVTVTRQIDRPPDAVARIAMEPANDTRWIGGISEARVLTSGPLAAGSRVARVASFLGKRIEYVNEIEVLEPGRRLVMRSVEGPFPMRVTYAFEPRGDATGASVRIEGDASGFYSLAAPLLRRQVRRSVAGDLERLAALVEAEPRAGTSASPHVP